MSASLEEKYDASVEISEKEGSYVERRECHSELQEKENHDVSLDLVEAVFCHRLDEVVELSKVINE